METLNLGFFTFFVAELILKLSAYGFKQYFHDRFNWFDTAVVLVSIVDVFLQYSSVNSSTGSGSLSALRVFRLIKIFQLAKIWSGFQNLLTVITNTIKDISNVSILLLIIMFTYAVLGMELFAYKAKFNEDTH